jgi:tripartite-type tricarboxylate transporter receptor subunit TctC
VEAVGSSPDEFRAAVRRDMAKWGTLIKDAGIRE